ncbi:MAG TPA: transporter [Mycobacterium sp.]|nr:transporter [Mycobacterium sp.]
MNTPTLIASLVMVAVLLVVVALVFRAMLRGWKRREHVQTPMIGALPEVPESVGAPILPEMTGLYVGSTLGKERFERVVVGKLGDRAKAVLTRYSDGIMLKRNGVRPLWIPDESITAIRTERVVAGKVAAQDGILAIRWRLPSGVEIDTGFRGDNRPNYADWTKGVL